jgi:toxin ParE1/3/4
MKKPHYTSAAQKDLAEIVTYIARDKPGAALAWVEKIEAKCLLIAANPALGQRQPHLGEGVRSSIVGRYVIFHRESSDRVEVLRVIRGDRDIRQL